MRDVDPTLRITAGTDQSDLRRAHLSLVLRSLRDHGPRSRAQLASQLRLGRASVSSLVGELEQRHLVRSGRQQRGSVGRPGTALALERGRVCGVGAEVNVDHVATMAVDLTGEVVAEDRRGLDTRRLGPEGTIAELADMLGKTVAGVLGGGALPLAITVGVAGLIDGRNDVVRFAPNLEWEDLPLAARLHERLGPDAPAVRLGNEANLAAVAERDPADPDRDDMLLLYGEVGVGGGLVADGRLVRGRHGYAGELGHMVVDPQGRACGCGRVGCWETVIGLRALLEAATDLDDPVRDPSLPLEDRLAQLVHRAERGDDRTLAALQQVGAWLGFGAAALVNALDPGVVVLSGYFAALGPWLRPAVEKQLERGVLAPTVGGPRVAVSTLGLTAAVRGAALVSLESVFTDPTRVPRAHVANGATT